VQLSARGAGAIGVFTATLLTLATPCSAAQCGAPAFIASFPPDGATTVPLNGTLSAVYATTANYTDETITLTSGGSTQTLEGSFDPTEHRLSALAPQLTPNTCYTLTWPGLASLTSTDRGKGADVHFTTSASLDSESPEFAGIRDVQWDLKYLDDACTNDIEPRYRFTFSLGPASDDGGTESLALLLFQSSGRSIGDDGAELVSLGPFPRSGKDATVDLPKVDGTGTVCFSGLARDLLGRISATASDSHCVKTRSAPFFYGCQLVGGGTPSAATWIAPLAVCGLLCLRRLRLRRARVE